MALTKSLSFSLGRKRILIANNSCNVAEFSADFESFAPMKRRCGQKYQGEDEQLVEKSSLLESLPQEILIKVICGVDHDDLKQLIHVSKTVRDATIIAKHSHFAYSTPSKTKVFRNSIDLVNNPMDFDDHETPNAPKQIRRMNRPRISNKKLEDVSVSLFADEEDDKEEERWTRRSLFI
ncbi:hypothetical protein Cgig2_003340 [Carnegiea gigantea]|uniref:F-box domain-containing protein n=1 Tax=Carnegiea gigantea TaxID=171969 RepID=A0A9Q1K1U7_9CARY|nr:hypothetical protein Cgig2_003340 [Carnegiea gigantea]